MNAWAFRLRPIADFLRRKTPSRLGWGALASIPGLALAGPSGENVVAGGAIVSRPNATHTQVDQSTARAVVNWSTFSVDSDEYVVFNQPGATASILNRVVGGNQSQIFGQIDANGRVFLVNPQGVYFAPGAQVNAAALTASVMDITDNNFMAGNYVFTRPSNAPDGATVENAGQINVSDGGFVVLAGDYANNTGIISARLGSVVLAAGSQMTLDLSEDGLVSFAVDEATVSSLAGANNSGQVLADGGQIIMTAKVANDLVATAVNNDGLLQARRIVADGGEIYLSAAGADIVQAGTIDVSGENGQSGGEVGITGDADITLTAGSQINANGSGAGNGGTVNVIADGMMTFRRDAEITARAGAEGESGGKVELSGHGGIQVRGNLKLGKGGELVIDPAVVGLVASSGSYGGSYGSTIGVGFIEDQLNSDVDVSVLASNAIFASSGVADITASSGSGNLTLRVTGAGGGAPVSFMFSGSTATNILNDGDIELTGVNFNILGDFTASAGTNVGNVHLGKVAANNVQIFTGASGGNITLNTGGVTAASSLLRLSAADDINIGTMAMPGNLNLTGGTVNMDIDAGGNINIAGNAAASGSTGSADINIDAGGNISIGNVIATGSGNDADISIGAGGNVNLGNVNATASGAGNASVVSGMLANALIFGRDVNVPGKITVRGAGMASTGDINAGLGIWAANNLNVAGDVLVSNPTGNAGTQYLFGGDAKVGGHIVNGGTNGWGMALFNATDPAGLASLPPGFVRGRTVTFNKLLDTNGGAGSRVIADVKNSIVTGPNGLIDAKYAEFTTRANITTNINVKTRAMSTTLKNLGQTPNVRYDNRAFVGPSSVNFNSGTVLKAASFFANGPLTFNGGFTASNLAVGVTNGTVTFGGPVNITGATPFLPTAPDIALFDIMSERGLLPPGHGPNVQIFARNGININQTFNVGGPSPFTKMYTNGPFNVSGLTTSSGNLLAVFSPIDTTRPIFFEDEPYLQPLGASGFFNFPTISGLPDNSNVTVVIGERGPTVPLLSGPVTIGARGLVDIGERNMFIITRGAVSGDDAVITDGIFEIIGLAQDDFFQVPLVNEFGDEPDTEEEEEDDDDDEELALGNEEGEDGDDGGVTQEGSGSESMECS